MDKEPLIVAAHETNPCAAADLLGHADYEVENATVGISSREALEALVRRGSMLVQDESAVWLLDRVYPPVVGRFLVSAKPCL